MGVIAIHHTKVDTTSAWDGPAEVAKLETPITAAVANGMFAYYESRGAPDDNGDGYPDTKGAYKFPHHNVNGSTPGDANLRGVNAAMARLSQADIPASNIAGIKAHLQAHQEDAKSIGLSRGFIEAVSDFAETIGRLIGIKRDVSLDDIWAYVQNQLDEAAKAQATPTDTTQPTDGTQPAPDMVTQDGGDEGDWQQYRTDYVLDVRTDGQSINVIITKSDGKMYKAPITVGADNSITVGEYVEVAIEFMPTARSVTVKRQADGRARWFAMPACTAVLNRSGEIDSRALFDSFVSAIERTGDYPILDFFHLGENIKLGRADWVARDGYAYCASGLFDDTPIARAAVKALETDPKYWGLSIAYIPTQEPETIRSADGASVNVYNTGINRFISLLPENTAASIMTSITTKDEGVNRMNEKVKAALEKLTGDDKALLEEYVLKLDTINRDVEAENMVRREGETTTKDTHIVETTAPAQPVAPAASASEVRAMTPDDMMTILDSPDFENKVIEIVKKLQAADTTPADTTQQNETAQADEAQARETELRSALTDLTAKLEGVITSVAELTKTREAAIQEVIDDMPEKLKNQKRVIIRPRASVLPDDLRNRKQINMAEKAAETLAAINQQN